MNELTLEGGTKEAREFIDKFLDDINFEEKMREISMEALMFGVEPEDTASYKKFLEEFKQ